MNEREFLNSIEAIQIRDDVVLCIEKAYGTNLNDELKHILSFAPEGGFVGDWRILSTRAILAANDELGIDFTTVGLIPVFDVMDGDFIVYHTTTGSWSMFNIYDKLVFSETGNLRNLLAE